MTLAAKLLKRFGPACLADYVKRPPDGCTLYRCEHGHDDCSHTKRGACLQELRKLLEGKAA